MGEYLADYLRDISLALYQQGADYAYARGIIIADTKFEFGMLPDGTICLIDEVLTPDSSRFWPIDGYCPGGPQPSFDKQSLRDWAESTGWDKNSQPPRIPEKVIRETRAKYVLAYAHLTGKEFPW